MLKLISLLVLCLQPCLSLLWHFHQAASIIPHPSKAHYGGEDAFFANSALLVLADGVGGWKNKGIDSGVFSRTLCLNAHQEYEKDPQVYSQTPKKLIRASQQGNLHAGSSTMVVMTVNQDSGHLKASYIGDSRYIIIRDRSILFEALEQQHSFNFPFQLASPESRFGSNPDVSIENSHQVRPSDIIVVASDGLFDNMFPRQIMEVIYKKGKFDKRILLNKQEVADHLTRKAIEFGGQTRYISPFVINAHKHHKVWRGGKLDDTTVIIAQLRKQKHSRGKESSSSTSSDSSSSSSSVQYEDSTQETQSEDEL